MAKKKNKLPKRIAGIKVPKTLRKSAPSLVALLRTPQGKEAMAAALSAAATALLSSAQGRRAVVDTGAAVASAAPAIAGGLESVGQVAGAVLKQAAESILPAGIAPNPESDQTVASPGTGAKPDAAKKQRTGSPADPISKH